MNRPLFVIVSFTVSTLAALAVSGALHAESLAAPAPHCAAGTVAAVVAGAATQACIATDADADE